MHCNCYCCRRQCTQSDSFTLSLEKHGHRLWHSQRRLRSHRHVHWKQRQDLLQSQVLDHLHGLKHAYGWWVLGNSKNPVLLAGSNRPKDAIDGNRRSQWSSTRSGCRSNSLHQWLNTEPVLLCRHGWCAQQACQLKDPRQAGQKVPQEQSMISVPGDHPKVVHLKPLWLIIQ